MMSTLFINQRDTPFEGDIRSLIDCLKLALRYKNVERHIINTYAWTGLIKILKYADTKTAQSLLHEMSEYEAYFDQADFEGERSHAFKQMLRDALLELLSLLDKLENKPTCSD